MRVLYCYLRSRLQVCAMTSTVTLPIWLFVLILLFAVVTFASHFLFPSVRWFFRRRMEKVVARLNTRLARPIQPFKLARRYDMIQRLIYDTAVIEAVAEHAKSQGVPENVAFQQARRYAREIVPGFSATIYFGFAIRVAKWLSRSLYRVRLGYVDEADQAAIDPEATVIFIMNHRSNMDYVLLTYLAAERSALSFAMGEWAHVWPLSGLLRSLGGYFIRRRSRDALYRRVLARYVRLATNAGVTQAVFPEGGLSLDGRVAPPKLGLISYILAGFDPETSRDVVFVPIGVNYDRVLEDRVLIDASVRGVRKFKFRITVFLRFCWRQLWLTITARSYRFGYASVSFGKAISMRSFVRQHPGNKMQEALGAHLMAQVEAVVPVLPVPLVATVLHEQSEISESELFRRVAERRKLLEATGIHAHLPREDVDYATKVGLRSLILRKIVSRNGDNIVVTEADKPMIAFYAASIAAHLAKISTQ